MSRDRLAQMKAERDRARGYGGGQQAAGTTAGMAPPQQQQYEAAQPQQYGGQQQQQPYGEQPMYPATGQQQQPFQGAYPQQQQQPGQYGGAPTAAPAQSQYAQAAGGQNQYEMQNMGYNGAPAQQMAMGPGGSMNDFFAEIDTITQSQNRLKDNINQINQLHNTVLNSTTDEARQEQAQRDLEALTQETSRLTNNLKLRIKNLSELNDKFAAQPGANEADKNTRRMQVQVQKKKFMDSIKDYREVEAKSREKYRARMERQYKIVKPDATQEEIRYAMDTDQGSQVFATALTQSTRYSDARNAYREVQERHEDIKRIAQTMQELQELFNDMAMLVERQDEQIQTIEATAVDVEQNMEGAHKQIEKGVVSAKKARRKRWICFWVIIIIIIAIVLAVTLSILSNQGKL